MTLDLRHLMLQVLNYTIAISMLGLVVVHLAGRVSDSVVGLDDAKHLAVITAGLCSC